MFGILRVTAPGATAWRKAMRRTSILAMIVVAGSAIAFPATAQQQQAAPSEQTREQMHSDVDKGLKTSEPNEQMQRDADKGIKTRNSGEFGYVADQDKPRGVVLDWPGGTLSVRARCLYPRRIRS